MGYEVFVGQARAVIDQAGVQIPTADVRSVAGASAPFAVAGNATMKDDGAGMLVVVGNAVGEESFEIVVRGTVAVHVVTVVGAPFDWSLGDEVTLV